MTKRITVLLTTTVFLVALARAQDPAPGSSSNSVSRAIETCANGEPTTDRGLPDGDSDGVPDATDNCLTVPNADQRDTDNDHFGNLCDGDLNNDQVVNVADLALLRADFFAAEFDPDADLDGDGAVALTDLAILRGLFFEPPGPTGPCLRDSDLCRGPLRFEVSDNVGTNSANKFMIRTADPAAVYHAQRLLSGASECNRAIAGYTYLGTQDWNPEWGYHINGDIYFHGDSVNASVSCNKSATFVEDNLPSWCSIDTRAPSTACQFWCPWTSGLTRVMPDADGG